MTIDAHIKASDALLEAARKLVDSLPLEGGGVLHVDDIHVLWEMARAQRAQARELETLERRRHCGRLGIPHA